MTFAVPSSAPSFLKPRIILTDVDDTLTWEGRLPAAALTALYRLEAAGIAVVPVTGACAGWCDHIARLWPVSAVIGENGAFVIERDGRHLRYHDTQNPTQRTLNRQRLHQEAERVLAALPMLRLAQDLDYRRYDLALDHGQEVTGIHRDQIDAALDMFHQVGIQATASSIHINAWIGDFSKPQASLRWLKQKYGLDTEMARSQCAFLGDSPNDQDMFRQFPYSVGVANIRPHLPFMKQAPAMLTEQPGGHGFAEWVDLLLSND